MTSEGREGPFKDICMSISQVKLVNAMDLSFVSHFMS